MLELPPSDLIQPRKVRSAIALRERLLEEQRRIVAAVQEAERALRVAEHQDAQALGEALLAEQDDPGAVNLDKARRTLAEARRKRAGFRAAIDQQDRVIRAAIESVRNKWLAELDAQAAEARETFTDSIAKAEGARDQMGTAKDLIGFLERFPTGKGFSRRRPDPSPIAALRGEAEPPSRVATATHATVIPASEDAQAGDELEDAVV